MRKHLILALALGVVALQEQATPDGGTQLVPTTVAATPTTTPGNTATTQPNRDLETTGNDFTKSDDILHTGTRLGALCAGQSYGAWSW